jgi:hypothetical protein
MHGANMKIIHICSTLIMLLHDSSTSLCITVQNISQYDSNRQKNGSYSPNKTLTYSLHLAVLEKLTGSQLVKKFHAFYGILRFIAAFTSARHLSLSWANSIQSISPHPTYWRSILILSSHLRQGLPSGLFSSSFPKVWSDFYENRNGNFFLLSQ